MKREQNFAEYLAKIGAPLVIRERAWNGLPMWWRNTQYGYDLMWLADAIGIDIKVRVRAAFECANLIEHKIPPWEADAFDVRKYALAWANEAGSLIRVLEACERLWHRIHYWTDAPYSEWALEQYESAPWYYSGWIFLSIGWACEDGHVCGIVRSIREVLGDCGHDMRSERVRGHHATAFPLMRYPWMRIPSVDSECANVVRKHIPLSMVHQAVCAHQVRNGRQHAT